MGSVITSKKGLLKLVNGQINIEVDGSKQPAKDGEQLPKGAVLHIGENATYEITFDDGTKLSNEVAPATEAMALPVTGEATPDEIQALQDLIASGEDPTTNLPETAAGNAPASDGSSGYVSLARDGSESLATSGYSTSGQTLAAFATNSPEQSIATDSPSILANDSNTVAEDSVATGNVLNNDSDVDNELSVTSFTVSGQTVAAGTTVALEGGSLVINTDGSYTFTPNANWNGQVPVITYTTNTGSTATLTINVTPVDDPSVVVNDTNTVAEDSVATGNVLSNDSDVDNELSVTSFTVSGQTVAAGTTVTLEGGSLVINTDGSYTFTPNANWNGQVPVITYTTNTGSTATLTINVTPVDDASVLTNDSNTVAEDSVATGNVLSNDSDVDNELSVISFTVNGQTVAAGTTVALEGGSLVINADGSYTFTPNANWNGQVPVITYTTNTGSTATLTINITPVANGGPSVTINTDTNNDGFISNEELGGATEVNVTIGLEGTGANTGDTLTVNGVDYILTQEDIDNGFVNLTLPAPAEGETITVVATITDAAGNTSPEGSDSAVLDTTGPVITVSAPDDTQDTTPTITGTTDAPPGSTITIVVTDSTGAQQTLTTTVNPDGTYAVDVTNPIAEGGYTAEASVTDPAGNTGKASDNGNVDTKIDQDGDGNTVAITAITQDTGSSSSDFITNDNTLIFKGTVDLGDNSTLAVTINGVVYTTANGLVIDAQGNWSVDLTGTVLPDGIYPVSATVTDVAGNSKTVTQDVVIDTKIDQDGDGNTVAITAITQDTGSSSSDFITNDNTLIFKGTVDLGDNSTLAVTINGVVYTTANGLVIDAQGNWSVDLTGTVLPDGIYPVSATVTDVAGNSKTVTQDVVIDTKIDQDGDGNTVAITAITQDTGSSSSDFITNDNTLIFKGTVDLGDNSTLAVTINGVVYTTANGLVIDAQGNWSVDLTGTVLPDGIYPVSATVTDVAGNSKTVTQDVVIDTKIDQDGDGNTVAITAITQDTGSSSSDFITNDNTLIFKGTVDLGDNSTLAVTINGVVYTTANGLVIDAQGNWSVDLTGTVLPDGTYPVSATVTDLAGNSKTVTQDVLIDTQGPSVVVNIVDDVLTVGETSEVTFTFSEKVKDFEVGDLTMVGGTVTDLKTTDGGKTWTGTFTPTPGFTGTASVTVNNGSYTDLNGNMGTGGQDTAPVDTQAPSVVVNIVDDKLTVGETSEVTFTFSEKVKDFEVGDLTVVGGTVTDLKTTDGGKTWTGTFTPTPGFTGTASVTVNNGSYTDLNGNVGTGGQDTAPVDTQAPSVVVNIVDDKLTVGETSEVTFTFSEKVKDFEVGDLTVVGGTVTDLKTTDGGKTWTGTFTPTPGFTGTASVTVNNGSYTDLNGNVGTGGQDTAPVDTQAPSVVVNIVDDKLTVGETSEVTFTFSEKVKDFEVGDLTVVGGTVTDLKTTDGGKTWTGTFTPTPGFTGTASVTVNNGSYTDLNGNVGTGGQDTAPVDTQAPSVVVNIVDDKLTVGETSEVTFTFSEKVKDFEVGDLTVVGGTVTDLKTTDGGKTWTGTFTPTPGFTGTASVTVNNGSYTDLNGNVGTGGQDTAPVDTQAPSVVVNIVDDKLTVGETSEVTFTFSEKVKDFEVGDLTVVGGTVTDLKTTDGGKTWTGTFTPTPGFTGTASVTVNNGSYTDLNGNVGTGGQDTAPVDTQAPSVVVNIVDDKLTVGETSEVTFTFSEKVKDFEVGDLTVVGGTVTDLKTTDGGKTWTGTFTPTPGFTGTASVTVNNGSYTDLNGNVGTGGQDTAPVDTQAPSVVVNIVDDKLTVGETSEVTFTFSEKVKDFEVGDLTVVGGTVTDLKTTDGGKTWTGTFTPTPGFTGTASVTVNNGSYTDLNGNVGTGGQDTAPVDTQAPSVVVNIVDDKLTVGETSEVTFTFSEKVKDFEVGDLTVVGGTVTDLKTTDGGKTWTGTFTPTPGFTGTASVTVNNGSYTDLNGNVGTGGQDTAPVDTQAPSVVVNIVDDKLTVGETSEVTFTFSEKVKDFEVGDLTVVGGTVTDLKTTDGGKTWTGTFTPTPGFTGTASVTVNNGSYTDLNGNVGTGGQDTAPVDTQAPSVVVNIVDDKLTVGETSEVTFTFSEKVKDFEVGDLTVVGGTVTDLKTTDGGKTWTGTFTPTPGFTGTASVTVNNGSYTDLNGNVGTGGQDTAPVDTQAPTAPTVLIVDDGTPGDGLLTQGEINSNGAGVQLTVSINAADFSAGGHVNLTIVNGTATSNVELKLVNGELQFANGTPATGFTYNNGTISWTETAPANGQSITVTATQTDKAGNTSVQSTDTAIVYTPGNCNIVVNESTLRDGVPNIVSGTINFTAGTQALTAFNFNSSSINAATNLAGHNITWAIATNGALIGSINGVQAIILTLSDISAIAPGTSGSITVNVELLDNLLQINGLNGENLSTLINGIVIEGTSVNGSVVTGNVNVEIVDDVPDANDDTGSVNVIVDSFRVSGVEANWTNWTNGTSVTTFDGNNNPNGGGTDNDSGLDQIRWGNPINTYKSGYGFIDNDSALNGQFALNQDIILGTFTHYNFPISSGGAITKATMDITFSVTDAYGVVTPVTLKVNFDHNETPNNDNDPEASKDIIKVGNTNVTFEHQGQVYTLQVIGFRVPGTNQVVTEIKTAENAASSYELVVRIVAGDGYALPSTTGNVLFNDVIGADNDLMVVGAAAGNQTGSGTSGNVGTIINGQYGTLIVFANGSYTYTVTANASAIPTGATETFTYTMQDADGDKSSALLTINVNTVNANALKAVQDQKNGPEDTAVIGNVLENDGNKNTSVTHFTVANSATQHTAGSKITLAEGELTLNADGSYTFTPAADWNGQVPVITYTTNTGATSTLTIVVTPVDDPTVTKPESKTIAEDALAKGNVLENDTDVDNTLSVTSFQVNGVTYNAGNTWYQLPEGTLQLKTNGEYSFDPKDHWSGSLPVITYTTNTGATSTLNITVQAVADAPNLTINGYTSVAAINFEDAKFSGSWDGVKANDIKGLNTIGTWHTSNRGGQVEIGYESVYVSGGSNSNKVMEIEFNSGDKTLYTDIQADAGRFYELGFDIAARSGSVSTSGLTIKLIPLDAQGNPLNAQAITLYDFDPTNANWLRDQKITLPINQSGKYRLQFEGDNGDSYGALLDNLAFKVVDNMGYRGEFIKLSNISSSLKDTDTSETLSLKLQGLPEGAVLKDALGNLATVGKDGTVDITNWDKSSLQIKVANHGNFTITVVATATETSNQDTAQSTADFQVTVLHPNNVVGGQSVDSFIMTNWTGNSAQFAVNLGGYGTVASSSKTEYIAKDTELLINAGNSNDYVDLGVSTANNIVNTGSSLPNLNNPVVTQAEILSSKFMAQDAITTNAGTLKSDVLQPLQPKTDTVNLGSGDDTVNGGQGSQLVYGGSGDDLLIGGEGIDGLRGGDGNDTLIGGLGDDVLRGDSGADTFVWRYADADKGTDHIMDFKVGEDKLDLSDLLQGETANTLESYLKFSLNNGSTVIDIDANKDGTFDQHIVLDGVNLYSQYGATNNAGIINGLLGSNGQGPLIIDTQPTPVDLEVKLDPLKTVDPV